MINIDLNLYKAIVESANDAVIVTTPELNAPGPQIVYANSAFARMTGWAPDEIIGKTPRVLQGPRIERALLDRLRRDLEIQKSFHGEGTNDRRDGSEYFVEWRIAPVEDDGKILYWVAIQRDVTARKRAEDRLLEENQRKDTFLAMLAHEPRNPLAPIRNSISLMRKHLEIGPAEVVQEKSPPLLAIQDHQADLRAIEVDRTRVEQVLINLLTNASKYTQPGGRISLRVTQDGRSTQFQVQDNGQGIDPGHLSRVSELFYQEKLTPSAEGGLGIGLTLVKQLIELHRGTVAASSQGRDKGTIVSVEIPNEVATPAEDDSRRPRILLVDDNPDAANTLAMILESHGHQAKACYRGEEAISDFDDHKADIAVAFLDLGRPRRRRPRRRPPYPVRRGLQPDARRRHRLVPGPGQEGHVQGRRQLPPVQARRPRQGRAHPRHAPVASPGRSSTFAPPEPAR